MDLLLYKVPGDVSLVSYFDELNPPEALFSLSEGHQLLSHSFFQDLTLFWAVFPSQKEEITDLQKENFVSTWTILKDGGQCRQGIAVHTCNTSI